MNEPSVSSLYGEHDVRGACSKRNDANGNLGDKKLARAFERRLMLGEIGNAKAREDGE